MGRRKSKVKNPVTIKKVWRPVASSSAPPPPPPWTELPGDVTANILHRLGAVEILESAQKVCTTWRRVCQDPAMWRVIEIENDGDRLCLYDLDSLCRQAVDRSQGQLVDISLSNFEFDDGELLRYICDRSSQLKRLTLAHCYDITGKGLGEAVKKIPQLEELHLVFMLSIFARDIEAIGTSCPMLKSFAYNDSGCNFQLPEDSEDEDLLGEGPLLNNAYALAVAKSMPNLRHLRLIANELTNEGLEAILNGCPNLESLDLRRCYSVDLGGDLGKRLSRQMKSLKHPSDPDDDYEFDAGESYMENYLGYDYESDTYSIGDYDDYTNPFSSEYLSDTDAMFFDFANAMGFGHDDF